MVRKSTLIKRKLAPFTFLVLQLVVHAFIFVSLKVHYSGNGKLIFLFLFFFAIPIIMETISFINMMFFDPGALLKALDIPPQDGGLTPREEQKLPKCRRCNIPQPPRSYHCRRCECCFVRHHSHLDMFGICIAIKNLRPFMVLLKWCEMDMIVCTIIEILLTRVQTLPVLIGFFFSVFYGALAFLFYIFWLDQMSYIKNNLSYSEKQSRIPKYSFDIGQEENIAQVFETGFFRYYIPKRSSMHGFEWLPEPSDDIH